MSNNLRQIAKDLRSFVKRCKDVHYSDSLLISFLITGLLTIAPKLHADVASEQQEVTAQTYDAITDLRQSFMRARQENERSLRGAESELAQLLKQGDQVIKSPWASFQFGTGYTNNDWGTTYRGRGGKFLEYYKRDNDLTKYVFDKDKHLYGATNLNIPRNQEPDALTINPANVYKAYEPTEVVKMDAMTLPNAPTLNPSVVSPAAGYYGRTYKIDDIARRAYLTTPKSTTQAYNAANANANYSNVHSTSSIADGVFRNSNIYTENNTTAHSNIGQGTSATGGTGLTNYTGSVNTTAITKISNGEMFLGTNVETYNRFNSSSSPYYVGSGPFASNSSIRNSWGGRESFNTDYWNNSEASYHHMIVNDQILYYGRDINHDYGFGGYANTYGTSAGAANLNRTYLKSLIYLTGATEINAVRFHIGSATGGGQTGNSASESDSGTTGRIGVLVNGGTVDLNSGTISRYALGSSTTSDADFFRVNTTHDVGSFNVYGNSNYGLYVKSGTVTSNGYDYIVSVNGSTTNGNTLNDGIFVEAGSLDVKNNLSSSSFNIGGTYSNGINLYGGSATVTGTSFTVGGTSNNGITIRSGATLTSISGNSSFTVNGTSSNGINAQTGAAMPTITNTSFTVSGTNSNGILKNTSNNTAITNGTFTVTGVGASGIIYSGGSTAETITNSTFNVSGGNTTAGIVMDDATKITVNGTPDTLFTVSNGSIGIEVNNNGAQAKTINFINNGVSDYVAMTLSGSNNVGININEGHMNTGTATNYNVTLTGGSTKGLDMSIQGDNNVGYNNTSFANSLTIESGGTLTTTNSLVGSGRIKIGTLSGSSVTGHNNNVVFANQAYVKGGSVKLHQVEVDGNNNTIAYFSKGNGNYGNSNWTPTNNAGVGFFNGNDLEFQGIIGKNAASNSNVAVYAASGQRSGLNTTDIIGETTGTTLNDLTITNLNVAVSSNATDTTLVYAENGTKVSVDNTNTVANGALIQKTISDGGVNDNGANKWGYTVPYSVASQRTTIGYAKGIFKASDHNFINNFPLADENAPTEIVIKAPVDMVSKIGTAYRAADGGRVRAEKETRAGGYQSIIAYAEDNASRTQLDTKETYESAKEGSGVKVTGSSVIIEKDIIAADNSLFSSNISNQSSSDRKYAYQNIGGYAVGGGDVIIKSTGVNASANGNTLEDDDTVAAAGKGSLIYGLGAYASGTGSNVIFDLGTTAKATIVSGTNGALYSIDNGYIEFAGQIVHQNNSGANVVTGTTTTEGAGITANAESRKGRNISSTTPNDHENVPVFYVNRTSSSDTAALTFNDTTTIDLYDGVFLSGNDYFHRNQTANDYNGAYSDFYKTALRASATDQTAWDKAKYRGMEKVDLNLVYSPSGKINLGLVNQSPDEIEWGNTQDKTGGTYLAGIANYAGVNAINNGATSNTNSTSKAAKFDSTLINSELKITTDVELENYALSNSQSGAKSSVSGASTTAVDPFNNIKMESTKVTIDSGKKVYGDAAFKAGQGLNMANSLYRWDTDDIKLQNYASASWRKTKNTESGYINKGIVSIWGETADTGGSITGINVAYGTIINGDDTTAGKIYVDHGNGMVGTDDSILTNKGVIVVTGKYDPVNQDSTIASTGVTNSAKARTGVDLETKPTGKNYGIVGISTNNVTEHSTYGGYRYGNNKVTISNIGTANGGTVEVDGELAVGIYAANVNQSGAATYYDGSTDNATAKKSNVTISYDNQTAASADAIKVNYGAGVSGGTTATQENKELRGVGIALVEKDKDSTAANRGGVITLNTKNNGIGATADILTYQNGIGIYAESSDIKFKTDSTGLTVDTGSDGAGIWVTDDSNISASSDRLGTPKALNYNYKGYNDKKGFGMIFGSTMSNTQTKAENYLDIKFNNNGDTNLTLTVEKNQTSPGTITAGKGTTRGIAGMLVNTDANDSVYNYGDIKEDTSKTNVRAYGAVVNKGRLVNYGNIELNDSLNVDASSVEKADLKKVNAGIMANDHTTAANTWIENYGDIKVGTTSRKNIGGFGIYGYNIITGEKADHTPSTITVNSNSYGIYSGDGTVKVQKGTKLLVGNDTVLGHVQTTTGKAITTNPSKYPINRQSAYSQASELLPGRTTDAAYGVYIGDNSLLSGGSRNVEVSADMDIDRYSYGIVLAKNTNAEAGGTNGTTVKIGDGSYTLDSTGKVSSLTPTNAPTIVLAANKNAGGLVKSTAPSTPKVPEEVDEQGNAVYYYSADKNSKASSFANVTMNGDYNTAYYTAGSVDNFGTIDLRSQNNLLTVNGSSSANLGYGNLGIVSTNPNVASTNYGTIITSMSDTLNQKYSAGMAAGRNVYNDEGKFVRFEDEGYVVNRGTITVSKDEGIGMFATGTRSKAINYGTIDLQGKKAIGMYLDRGAQGENYGTITGDAEGVKGVVALNNGYIKNYGTIRVTGTGSVGIITDNINVKTDNEDPSKYNGGTEEGKAAAIKYVASGDEKTTGVGTTITVPDTVPLTKITVDGVDTPIFDVESDAAAVGDWAKNITVSSSIQTGGTRIIDLSAKNEWGNPVWEHAYKEPLSEVTSIGMYVDTSGVRYTNPIDGIQNLPHLSEVNLYFGPEATLYTNSKAIRIGDKVDVNGNVTKSNILKPFNDALSNLPGGAIINPLSASLTWQVKAKLDSNNQLSEVYMSKVPYHSFAYDNDKSLVNFTNNLDNIYEIAKPESAEKVIFNKLNSLGNGEGHILAQAFDQMRGHIYGGVQQRIKATSDVLGGEINGLRSESNGSKDSNKFKAFGQRNEYKTDTAGMPDWDSNAGGFAFVHEDETVRLGQSSGWYAGVVNNYYTFKDLSKSYENQAMAKFGAFKSIPLDSNGTFVLSVGGDGFIGRNDMKRRFWVIDQQFRAKSSYYSYGAGLNAGLEKAFVVNDGFSIVPNLGIRAEYGRFSSIHENGDMALNVKSDDYISVKPSAGIDFRYSQPVFDNSTLTAVLGFRYENEIGKLYDVENEARIVGAWTDYFGIRGDKEDKRGNFKSDLKLGLDNGRFGFNINTGYDTKGHNFKAGLGLKVLY